MEFADKSRLIIERFIMVKFATLLAMSPSA